MPVKVLKNDGQELRVRIIGGNHTTLQMFRARLNDMAGVEYANYFQNHPDLDDPELYVRVSKGKKADKVLKDVCSAISKEFSTIKL
ncbi:MAG TPA: RpoL/Rpb11 RNA polymerase subunit family protein [Candidatus Thalassarchaeaceae archaeon]|nr:RpoL/Rpb11 RNA polymerase subunit family protein [Candidatus Thalassarchaeaceae archaeon]